jgi:hypothetical protein
MALISATKKIDRQVYRGVKAVTTQTLQFPRALYVDDAYNRNIGLTIDNVHGEGWYVETAVAQAVKEACCEEAIAILKAGADANKRAELQAQGVKSYSVGNLSETFTGQSISGQKLLSLEAKDLLRPYIGGVPIC